MTETELGTSGPTPSEANVVRRSVVVEATPEKAFSFFTRDIAKWWDPNKHLLAEPLAEMVFEERVGGHIIDRSTSGTENRWATVLVWDPPNQVVFSWDISLAWIIEADPSRTSEVDVTFRPVGPGRTEVVLEHRHLERHGTGWESMRHAVDAPDGWDLEPYAAALRSAA